MKLKQIVCDGTNLNLIKEKKVVEYGEVFEVDDECGNEILTATYKNKPVVELVEEVAANTTEDKPVKKATTRNKTSK